MKLKYIVDIGTPLPPIEDLIGKTEKEQNEILKRTDVSVSRTIEEFIREEGQTRIRSSKEHKSVEHGANGVRQDEKRPDNKVRNERS